MLKSHVSQLKHERALKIFQLQTRQSTLTSIFFNVNTQYAQYGNSKISNHALTGSYKESLY